LVPEFFAESDVLGLDPSASYVDEARRRWGGPRVRFAQLGAAAAAEPVDLIYVNGVLHHVEPAARRAFFADAVARLSERGVLALFENNPWNPGARLVMSRIEFDRDAVLVPSREARTRMSTAGLRVEWTRFLFYFPRPLRALRPLEPWLARIPLGAQYAVFGSRNTV
jgi:trans-aconitate methyltransferase